MNRLMMLFLALFAITPVFSADPPAKPTNVRGDSFFAVGRDIIWDGPDCNDPITPCYQYVWTMRDLTTDTFLYTPPEDYEPSSVRRFSIPNEQNSPYQQGHIYQFLVYSHTEGGGYSNQAAEFTFIWNGNEPVPFSDNLTVYPLGTLTQDRPQFYVTPTRNLEAGYYYWGFRDPSGAWLEPDWRDNAAGALYTPRTPLKEGVTYDVVLAAKTDYGRLEERVIGTVVYPGPAVNHSAGGDTWMGSTEGTPIADITFNTAQNAPLDMNQLRFGFFDERGRHFDGFTWNYGQDVANHPFSVIIEQGFQPGRRYDFLGNGQHRVRFFWQDADPSDGNRLAFWAGAGNQITAQLRVPGTAIYQQHVIDRLPRVTTADPNRQEIDGTERIQLSVDLNHGALTNRDLRWLWRDADNGQYWDGTAWLNSNDVAPWQNLRTAGSVQASYWPQMALDLQDQGNRLTIDYQLGGNTSAFFAGKPHRRLHLVFDNGQTVDLNGPVTAEVTVFHTPQTLRGMLSVTQWGIQPRDDAFDGIALTANNHQPVQSSIEVNQDTLAGFSGNDPRSLVFRLYQPSGNGFVPIATSIPLPLNTLSYGRSDSARTAMQQQVAGTLTSLYEADGNAALQQQPNDRPLRLAAFISDQVGNDTTTRTRLQPSPQAGNTDFRVYLSGKVVPVITEENNDQLLANGTPLAFRVLPEQQPLGFLVQQSAQSEPQGLAFPSAKRWRAAANKGDVISVRLLHQNRRLYNHHWRLFTREEGNAASEILVESLSDVDHFALDDDYLEDIEYRLQMDAVDRFGLPVSFSQVFGSIRDLSGKNLWLRWGSRNPDDDKFSVTDGEQKTVTSDYYGSRIHYFALRSLGLTRDAAQMTSLFEGTEAKFDLAYFDENGPVDPIRINVGHILTDPYQLPICDQSGANPNPTYPHAPYPVTLNRFTIIDSWTGKTYDYGDASLRVEHAPGGLCDYEQEVYPENGAFAVENAPFTWYYHAASLKDFSFEGRPQFDSAVYNQYSDWTIGFTLYGPDNLDTPVTGNKPLSQYLRETNQSLRHGDTLVISARDLHPYGDVDTETDPDAPLTRWQRALFAQDLLDLIMLQGSSQRVRAYINIYRQGADGQTQWLMRSQSSHAGGIAIDFKPGLPPERHGVTSLAYHSHAPTTVQVYPHRPHTITLRQTLNVNSNLTSARVQWDAFQWRWTSHLGFWNGQVWQSPSQWHDLGGGQGTFGDARVSYLRDSNQIEVEWTVATPEFFYDFWPDNQPRLPVSLEIAYRPQGGAEVLPSNPNAVTTIPFIQDLNEYEGIVSPHLLNSGTDADAPLALLEGALSSELRSSLNKAFAPEPLTLEGAKPYLGDQHYWGLGASAVPSELLGQTDVDLGQTDLYALLSLPFDSLEDHKAARAFLVPYPDHHEANMPWSGETLTTTVLNKNQRNTWQRSGHVFFRYADVADSSLREFHIVIFVKASTLQRSPLSTTFAEPEGETNLFYSFAEGTPHWQASATHNRLITITSPDPDKPEKRVVSVKFLDLNGRHQETRTMATHRPMDTRGRLLVDHIVRYDLLGRPIQVGKPFYGSDAVAQPGQVPYNLVDVLDAENSFLEGMGFWRHNPDVVGDKNYPYAEFKYTSDDARSDLAAIIPIGDKARDPNDPLRYLRTHRFVIPVHPNSGFGNGSPGSGSAGSLYIGLPGIDHQLLPVLTPTSVAAHIDKDGGAAVLSQDAMATQYVENQMLQSAHVVEDQAPVVPHFGLEGTLEIDADGFVRATLYGLKNRKLVTINNPPPALLQHWGFTVQRGGNPTEFQNDVIHLTPAYLDRWDSNGVRPQTGTPAEDLNVTAYHEYDRLGRATRTFPPKVLQLQADSADFWRIELSAQDWELMVQTNSYDAMNRLIATTDPDRGTHSYVRDRHGRTRFEQREDFMPTSWLETAYDPQGREIGKRLIDFPNADGNLHGALQTYIDNNPQTFPDVGFADTALGYQLGEIGDLRTDYVYDVYDVSVTTVPFANTTSGAALPVFNTTPHYWPHQADLAQGYPWSETPVVFGNPAGKLVEIQSFNTAERIYYDQKGRSICRVNLIRGLLEPQITWFQYDAADRLTATYNQTQNIALAYIYDAYDRLVSVWDVAPLSERMLVHVAFLPQTDDLIGEYASSLAALGPLVDDRSELAIGTAAKQLTGYEYAPTGHVAAHILGDRDSTHVTTRFQYDLRDWLIAKQTQINDVPVFDQQVDYDGVGGLFDNEWAVPARYNGAITHLNETYHLTQTSEGYDAHTIRHKFGYDGAGQLLSASSHWDEWIHNRYRYDRNGSRTYEQRSRQFHASDETRYDADYNYINHDNNNRLLEVRQAPNGSDPYAQVHFDYSEAGDVTHIQRYRPLNTPSGLNTPADVDQRIQYSPGYTHAQPYSVVTALSDVEQADHNRRFQAMEAQFRYDQNGTRIWRRTVKNGEEKVTFFSPNGYENATEFDGWGRAKRGYLFSGNERFGYKSKHHTGVYIKDHVNTTKMVAALYRRTDGQTTQSRNRPDSGDETGDAGDDDPDPTLVALSFENGLANAGHLGDGAAVGTVSYQSRGGERALWLEPGDVVNLPDHASAEALTKAFTVAAWVYDNDIDDGVEDHGTIMTVGTSSSIRYNPLHFYIDGGKNIVLRLGGGTDGWQFFGGLPRLAPNTWTHVAATFDGGQVRLYHNGVAVGEPQAVTLGALYPSQQIAVGDWIGNADYRWHGGLDEVQLHSRVLTSDEIATLHQASAGAAQTANPPLVKLSFDGDLFNAGSLAEATPVGPLNYLSRDGDRALWLEPGEVVNVPDHPQADRLTEQFTVSAWIYDNDIDDGIEDHGTIVAVGTSTSIRYNPLHLYIDGGKNIVLRLGGGADGWQFFGGTTRLAPKTWVHVAATYDGSQVRLYHNGVAVGDAQAVTLPALYPSRQIAVGDWVGHAEYRWHGGLDEVQLYDRAMTASDVSDLYAGRTPGAVVTASSQSLMASGTVASPAQKEAVAALLVVKHSDNDPYGISLRQEEGILARAEGEPHQFTGQEREPDLGLTYMNGRWYASEFGRFLQPDPMNEFWNSYAYVGNDPINQQDPSGLHTAQEVATMEANRAFRNGSNVKGYVWLGVSGFASTTDNISKAFDHHFISQRDDVTGWTYVGAVVELADVIPFGKAATGIKRFFGIGKGSKAVSAANTANDTKGAISMADEIPGKVQSFMNRTKEAGCFVAGTLVWTEHGMVPIEDVVVGDRVWSRSDTTGLLALKTVEQELVYQDKETYVLRLEGTNGETVIEATGDHPFWTEPGRWAHLKDLDGENRVWTEAGWKAILSLEKQPGIRTVYNLTVANYHTYFVSENRVWVHNSCDDLYEVHEGVRRTKAAELNKHKTIKANVMDENDRVVETIDIPIENIRSPRKSKIDLSGNGRKRFQDIMEATREGNITVPIEVRKGDKGVKIKDILFGMSDN